MIYDEIVDICEVGEIESIDIEVSGNHYFYANDILTHNSNSDPGMEDISESFGTAATVDFMISIVATEQLDAVNQILVKQLKNRFADPSTNKRFVLGIDRARMRLYDVAQTQIADSGQDDVPIATRILQQPSSMMNGNGDK